MNITLLDGREMALHLKKEQPDYIKPFNLELDTTRKYLALTNQQPCKTSQTILERGISSFHQVLFVRNILFLNQHAEQIYSDSRMFFAPVKVNSGLAYFGDSAFKKATLGVYLEWWRHFREASITPKGEFIFLISGSPLSGAHACGVIAPDGKTRTAKDLPVFSNVWHTFIDVVKCYSEAAQQCETYSLEDVLIRLRGEEYREEIEALCQECIDNAVIYNNCSNWPQDGTDLKKKVKASRKTQMQIKWREIMGFYDYFSHEEEKLLKLKKEGNVTEYRKFLHDLAVDSTRFISETFGKNTNRICLTDILNYAKYRKSLEL